MKWLRAITAIGKRDGSPSRELMLIFVLKVLESFADFATSLNLVLYLSDEFGYSDLEAGSLYGLWGVCAGAIGIVLGPVIDRIGIRWSLLLGGTCTALGRAGFAITHTKAHAFFALFVLQPVGMALGIPVLSIGVRRLTTPKNVAFYYGVFYTMMNVAALFAGLATDALNAHYAAGCGRPCTVRTLFWISTGISVLYVLVAWTFRPFVEEGARPQKAFWHEARVTVRDPVFWRLVVFSAALFGARSIFRHMDTTLPKWMLRTIGPDADYGTVYAINPFLVILTASITQHVLRFRDPYAVVLVGTLFSTVAPFALAWFSPSYMSAALFMVLVSMGEVVYSPKLYEFSLALAPPGKEGMYGTLAALPLFAVRLLAGSTGGRLLQTYCPADPPRRCQTMWAFIGFIAATTPLTLMVFHKFLYSDVIRTRLGVNQSSSDPTPAPRDACDAVEQPDTIFSEKELAII